MTRLARLLCLIPFLLATGSLHAEAPLDLSVLPAAEAEDTLVPLHVPDELSDAIAYPGPQGIRPGPRPDGRPLRLYRNEMVDSLMRFFLVQKRGVLERGWRRSGRYMDMIRRTLLEEGVPPQLAYLVGVESNFNPVARSPARAVGLWQFTAPTARKFGLRIYRPWYDERLDPEASTQAAARLLAYLYDRYENWELALAAYNAGEARVNRAIARARSTGAPQDYWNLRLPAQTRGFVPAFLAIAAIMEAPTQHGLDDQIRDLPLINDGLQLTISATLADLATRLNADPADLARRNPAWKTGTIPPFDTGAVLLRLPAGGAPRLIASLAERPPEPIPWLVHAVEEGETVSGIANNYGVRTRDVLELNDLGWRSLVAIGQRLLVPVPAETPEARAIALETAREARGAAFVPASSAVPAVTQLHLHRVQSGESLWSIAQYYGVRMTELRLWNQVVDQVLHPNQELVVFLPLQWSALP